MLQLSSQLDKQYIYIYIYIFFGLIAKRGMCYGSLLNMLVVLFFFFFFIILGVQAVFRRYAHFD